MSIATSFWRLLSSGKLFMTKMKKSFHWVAINRKIPSYVLAAFGFLPVLAFALTTIITPTITGVVGAVQTGQTLTITGSSMIQEDRTNWDPFFINNPNASGFEGASVIADGYDTSCGSNISYDSTLKLMGLQSVRMHDSGQHIHDFTTGGGNGSCMFGWQVQGSLGLGPADIYLRTYSRWNNNSWPNSAIKYWWMAGNGTNYAYYNFDAQGDGSPPSRWGVSTSGGSGGDAFQWGNIPGGPIQNNKWYLFEAHFRRAGSSASYIFEGWIDNQLVLSVPSSDGPGPADTKEWESNVNYWDTTASFVSDQWQDGFAVSSTRVGPASLIEIGNCLTYGSGAKLYQEPLSLSDVLSQVKVNLSGLGSGPYVLWVTNNGKARSLGFQLPGTGTGNPSCAPALLPPANLRVQ